MLEVSDDHFPLIIARWRDEASFADAEAYITWYEKMIDRAIRQKVRLVCVSESHEGAVMGSQERKRMVEWMSALHLDRQKVTAAVFVVVLNPLGRGILMAFKWMSSSPTMKQLEICGSREEAFERAFKVMEAEGHTAPRELLQK